MKKTIDPTELVPAAQTAGADDNAQSFWLDVEDYLAKKAERRAQLVAPRRLTDAPERGTV